MNSKKSIRSLYKQQYFWDVDTSKLDDKKNQRLIIERIITLGTLNEINLLLEHYGRSAFINTCKKLRYLDRKTLNFISILFEQQKESFSCNTTNPLKPRF